MISLRISNLLLSRRSCASLLYVRSLATVATSGEQLAAATTTTTTTTTGVAAAAPFNRNIVRQRLMTQARNALGYKTLTDVQKTVIPLILDHKDVLFGSETGSGASNLCLL